MTVLTTSRVSFCPLTGALKLRRESRFLVRRLLAGVQYALESVHECCECHRGREGIKEEDVMSDVGSCVVSTSSSSFLLGLLLHLSVQRLPRERGKVTHRIVFYDGLYLCCYSALLPLMLQHPSPFERTLAVVKN